MKKGELSMQVIVIAALALIVLVTLILVFRGQITKTTASYSNISDASGSAAEKAQSRFMELFDRCQDGKSRQSGDQTFCCIDGQWEPHSAPCPGAK